VLFRSILVSVLRAAHLPGGIALESSCPTGKSDARYSLPATTAVLSSVLDTVAGLDSNYRWEMHNGIINLLGRSASHELLDVTIHDFVINKPGSSINSGVGELLETPEVKQALARLKLHEPGPSLILWMDSPQPNNIHVDVHNVTVREALNEIAKAHGYAVWKYSESRCNGENTFSVTWVGR